MNVPSSWVKNLTSLSRQSVSLTQGHIRPPFFYSLKRKRCGHLYTISPLVSTLTIFLFRCRSGGRYQFSPAFMDRLIFPYPRPVPSPGNERLNVLPIKAYALRQVSPLQWFFRLMFLCVSTDTDLGIRIVVCLLCAIAESCRHVADTLWAIPPSTVKPRI